MNDKPAAPPSDAVLKARRALEMKRNAAEASTPPPKGPLRRHEIDAAARAAAKSKPKVRK
jgi:hypothetical protein